MKVPDVKRQPVSSTQKPFTTYVGLSIVFHVVLIIGLAIGARWLNRPKRYQPTSHTVSLVDAPSTLKQTPPPEPPKTAAKKSASKAKKPAFQAKKPASQQSQSAPQPETTKPQQAPPKQIVKPKKTVQTPKRKQPAKAATSRSARTAKRKAPTKAKRPASASKPQRTVKASPPASKTKRQKASKPSPSSSTPRATTKADRDQQRAARQRLAALRSRYGKFGESTTGAETAEGLQHVRLRAYQELVREQIVDAWVLPLLQDTTRHLQATALLTIDREGRITQLEILETSNNPLFDASLLRAIRQAAPLPALPEDYHGSFLELELHFKPGEA